jgi:hypothetical protein
MGVLRYARNGSAARGLRPMAAKTAVAVRLLESLLKPDGGDETRSNHFGCRIAIELLPTERAPGVLPNRGVVVQLVKYTACGHYRIGSRNAKDKFANGLARKKVKILVRRPIELLPPAQEPPLYGVPAYCQIEPSLSNR